MLFIWLGEELSYICPYLSWETIQMQVALASAQNTQNCFKYPSKLAVNMLCYSIRMSSFQIM